MIFEGFSVEINQIGPVNFLIKIKSPDNNIFVGQVRTNQINEAGVYHEWKNNKSFRDQFFLEIDTVQKNDIVKT